MYKDRSCKREAAPELIARKAGLTRHDVLNTLPLPALRQALGQATRGSTQLIVSQRISTIRHAEQIIVMDEGRIAGKGTHAELMKSNTIYREIAQSQLSMEVSS